MKYLILLVACCLSVSASPWRTAYFFQPGGLSITAAPFSKYTHVIEYAIQPNASCGIDDASYQIASNYSAFTSTVHAAGAKALVSLFNDNSGANMATCTNGTHLSSFVTTVKAWAQSRGFDGVDFDWETAENTTQFGNLISALRSSWPGAVLTIGAGITDRVWLKSIYSQLDQINLMTYDLDAGGLDGNWSTMTRYNHMLHNSTDANAMTVDAFVSLFTAAGIPAAKLGVGIPYYARIKTGQQSNCSNYVNGPEQQYCSGNALSNGRSAEGYNGLLSSAAWQSGTRVIDSAFGAQYVKYDNGSSSAFISFTGPEQIQMDLAYVNSQGLGGVMVYELEYEYVSSASGDARYPLSTALAQTAAPAPPPAPPPIPKQFCSISR